MCDEREKEGREKVVEILTVLLNDEFEKYRYRTGKREGEGEREI